MIEVREEHWGLSRKSRSLSEETAVFLIFEGKEKRKLNFAVSYDILGFDFYDILFWYSAERKIRFFSILFTKKRNSID